VALLNALNYDPTTVTTLAPASGRVMVRLATNVYNNGNTTALYTTSLVLGVMQSTTKKGGALPTVSGFTNAGVAAVEVTFPVTGLTSGTSYTWDAAVQSLGAPVTGCCLKWGGPYAINTNDSYGGFRYEIYG
jgi:hypothetical protein